MTHPVGDPAACQTHRAGGAGEDADGDEGEDGDAAADAWLAEIQTGMGTTTMTETTTTQGALRHPSRRAIRGTDRTPGQALQTCNRETHGTVKEITLRRGYGHSWTRSPYQTNSSITSTPRKIRRT